MIEEEYYIICLEEKSIEGTLLFWKPEAKGYTSDFEKAGLFNKVSADNVNIKGRDIALTKKELFDIKSFKLYTVANCSSMVLIDMKKEMNNGGA